MRSTTARPNAFTKSRAGLAVAGQSFRGRELRAVPEDLLTLTAAVADENVSAKIFEQYNFVSPAVWMGIVSVVIFVLLLVPAVLCTMNIQTPTQFEKKPLLATS